MENIDKPTQDVVDRLAKVMERRKVHAPLTPMHECYDSAAVHIAALRTAVADRIAFVGGSDELQHEWSLAMAALEDAMDAMDSEIEKGKMN